MAIPVHKYPYSNLHDLNLDWVLNELKELKDKVEELEKSPAVPESLISDVQDLKEKVALLEGYITTLNNNFVALEARVSALEQQQGEENPVSIQTTSASVITPSAELTEVDIPTVYSDTFSPIDI